MSFVLVFLVSILFFGCVFLMFNGSNINNVLLIINKFKMIFDKYQKSSKWSKIGLCACPAID